MASGASAAVATYLAGWWDRNPVTATFAGAPGFDHALPDWSPAGLERAAGNAASMREELVAPLAAARHALGEAAWPERAPLVDLELARAALEIEGAEYGRALMQHGNPSLAVGEAVFGVIALMLRDASPLEERWRAAAQRMSAFPAFFAGVRASMTGRVPEAFVARAHRECEGATVLLRDGVPQWLGRDESPAATAVRRAVPDAMAAVGAFAAWLVDGVRVDNENAVAAGENQFALLYERGHWTSRPAADWLREAQDRFAEARARLATMAGAIAPGGWADVQKRLTADHVTGDDYLGEFDRCWRDCREVSEREQLVDWPDAPLRFAAHAAYTRDAAPFLYYLPYRSPAPLQPTSEHVHELAPADASVPDDVREARRRAMTRSQIKLNHVVHHAAIGHHVQNWHAARSASAIGRFAAVDGASRIALLCGGSLAEGWACYATDLMDEAGFFTPDERVAEQHTRVRLLGRLIADVELHRGAWSLDRAATFYTSEVGMAPAVARAEAVKNAMFPATASMYWIGLDGLHRLRVAQARALGPRFARLAFHQQVLTHGAIPVPLIAELMSAAVPA